MKNGFKNKTQARKARKALGKNRPIPKPGFGHNGLTKGPACTIGKVNKCGAEGATSLATAKKAKQRPARLSLTAKKEKKATDRKGNRQVAVKIKLIKKSRRAGTRTRRSERLITRSLRRRAPRFLPKVKDSQNRCFLREKIPRESSIKWPKLRMMLRSGQELFPAARQPSIRP